MIETTNRTPIWCKHNLTIKEAADYFNIGEKKLYQIVQDYENGNFYFTVGTKTLIKRVKFGEFIDEIKSL